MGQILSDRDSRRVEKMLLAFEGNANEPPDTAGRRFPRASPNIRAILLENLDDDDVADAAVTELNSVAITQRVYLEGEADSGTFTLTFKGKTTTPLQWNASAPDVQTALEALETIGKGNVSVSLGKTSEWNPGVWAVRFLGKLAAADTPLMTGATTITGAAVVLIAGTHWLDSGEVVRLRSAIPVGVPTPLRAGAVVLAAPIGGAGYCVWAVESRDFDPYGPPYGI